MRVRGEAYHRALVARLSCFRFSASAPVGVHLDEAARRIHGELGCVLLS